MVVSTFAELEYLTATVWALAGADSQLCQRAVTWLIVNRLQSEPAEPDIVAVCNGVLAEGLNEDGREKALPPQAGLSDPRFCGLALRVLEVLARAAADPTAGARCLHRHDRDPEWSRDLEPVALIGNYFFYEGGAAPTAVMTPEPDGNGRCQGSVSPGAWADR